MGKPIKLIRVTNTSDIDVTVINPDIPDNNTRTLRPGQSIVIPDWFLFTAEGLASTSVEELN